MDDIDFRSMMPKCYVCGNDNDHLSEYQGKMYCDAHLPISPDQYIEYMRRLKIEQQYYDRIYPKDDSQVSWDDIARAENDYFQELYPGKCGSCTNMRVASHDPSDTDFICYQDGEEIDLDDTCRFVPSRYKKGVIHEGLERIYFSIPHIVQGILMSLIIAAQVIAILNNDIVLAIGATIIMIVPLLLFSVANHFKELRDQIIDGKLTGVGDYTQLDRIKEKFRRKKEWEN